MLPPSISELLDDFSPVVFNEAQFDEFVSTICESRRKVVAKAGKKIYDREASGSEGNVERVVHMVMCSRYVDQCGSIIEQAAALAVSLAKGHVFPDGNKRTAVTVLHAFLRKWTSEFVLPYPEEEQEEDELSEIIQKVAAGEVSKDGLTDWIRKHIIESSHPQTDLKRVFYF